MGFSTEFKQFAAKGNVVDLAVGVIIGGAFGRIVDSLVGDVVMPLVSNVFGALDFSSYYIPLADQASGLPLADAKKAGAVFAYGSFLTVSLNFLILALVIFVMVRQINRLRSREEPVPEPAPEPEDVKLLREIRDSLRR